MKIMNKFKKSIGKKNIMLSIVALILILLTTVSISYSWIEEVSNVELMSNDDSQQTPLHISGQQLKSNVEIQNDSNHIDLSDFFAESGDMHLSACYSDGTDFAFPKSGTSTTEFRKGTKSDANTNYISMTFRVKSNAEPTAYWFEYKNKSSSNLFTKAKVYTRDNDGNVTGTSNYTGTNTTSALKNYLRASITVNGATTVYGFNDSGQFNYINSSGTITTATGSDNTPTPRAVKNYMYYNETPNNSSPVGYYKNSANKTNKPNQGNGNNLNGNTLFTIGKDKTETVTIKLWLEGGAPVTSVDVSDLNLQLASSWVKERRIYVRDMTVKEPNPHDTTYWLPNGDAKMYWGIKNDDGTWTNLGQLTRYNSSHIYYLDIPSVYNGRETALFRCKNSFTTSGSDLWDKWETVFPDTFHSETFSVYSTSYGTWSIVDATAVYFVDSGYMEGKATKSPSVYLWDSTKIIDATMNGKVVKNADWTGAKMTKMGDTTGSSNQDLGLWAFFYASDFDRAVFNDTISNSGNSGNAEYQSQNIHYSWTSGGQTQNWEKKYFDMATLDWYASPTKLPKYTDHYIECDFPGGNNKGNVRFSYKGSNTESATGETFIDGTSANTNEVARMYVKWGNGDGYNYKFRIHAGSKTYGVTNQTLNANGKLKLYENNSDYGNIHLTGDKSIHSIYLKGFGYTNDGKEWVEVYLSNDIKYPETD